MGVHDGHRQRMRERFEKSGLDSFDSVNVLELLLFYALPRRDTNVVAHKLLDTFGSLNGVLEADIAMLESVEGVGHSAALFLRLIGEVARRKDLRQVKRGQKMDTFKQIVDFMQPLFGGLTVERVYVLLLDGSARVISCDMLDEGVANRVKMDAGKLLRIAISKSARAVVLAHNHVDGTSQPSDADRISTKHIAQLLNTAGIQLIDHIIFSGRVYCSMADLNLI